MTYITLNASDKEGSTFNAYVARPDQTKFVGPRPVIIVIQEIFGINQGVRDKCHWLAAQGFIACAPDLFWRIEPGIELSDQNPDELQRAFDLFGQFNVETGIDDLRATYDMVRNIDGSNGKVGCLGYCLGGKLAYLMACQTDIDASIGYYGVGIQDMLDQASHIQNPLMLHIAGQDSFVPPPAQEKIINGLSDYAHVTLHHYADMEHAFTREGGDHYDADQAKIADARSIAFLTDILA